MKKLLLITLLSICLTQLASAQAKSPAPGDGSRARVVNFYPNPASTFINFDLKGNYRPGYSLQIFNFIGKPVKEIKNVNEQTTFYLGDFYRGIYIFKLVDRNGLLIESGKFQIIK